jgi:hypothetical protein
MHSLHQHRTVPLPFRASSRCPVTRRTFKTSSIDRTVIAHASHRHTQDSNSSSSTSTTHSATTTKRQLGLSAAALTAGMTACRVKPSYAVAVDGAAAAAAADALPQVPHVQLAPNAAGFEVSKVIKGCWQLSGGHKGDKQTDRTGGEAAVRVSGWQATSLAVAWGRAAGVLVRCAVP